jgi:hypothetical protein
MSETKATIPNRPTPEFLASLFSKHGIQPRISTYLEPRYGYEASSKEGPCGCEIGALFAEAMGGINAALNIIDDECPSFSQMYRCISNLTGLHLTYIHGVDDGFTLGAESSSSNNPDPLYQMGFTDGVAAHRIVFAEEGTQ